MRKLYQEIDKILVKIKWNDIWPGFHRYPYALYNEETIWLKSEELPYNNRFMGNTSIEWNQGYLAIWCVKSAAEEDAEELASGIVHEMFHAFQQESGETRYPNDLKMLDYPLSVQNFTWKYNENVILTKAYLTNNRKQKLDLLSQFAFSRTKREKLIGAAVYNEYLAETLEGMAEYAGLSALRQMDEEKYRIKINSYLNYLKEKTEILFDIRRISYFSGVIYLLTLFDSGIDIFHRIGKTEETVYEISMKNIDGKEVLYNPDENIRKLTELHIENIKNKIKVFFSQPRKMETISGYICGYDPMNMVKYGRQLMCSRFIFIFDEETQKPVYINGPVIVELQENSDNMANKYYK